MNVYVIILISVPFVLAAALGWLMVAAIRDDRARVAAQLERRDRARVRARVPLPADRVDDLFVDIAADLAGFEVEMDRAIACAESWARRYPTQ